jgi:hypothetical protein
VEMEYRPVPDRERFCFECDYHLDRDPAARWSVVGTCTRRDHPCSGNNRACSTDFVLRERVDERL